MNFCLAIRTRAGEEKGRGVCLVLRGAAGFRVFFPILKVIIGLQN